MCYWFVGGPDWKPTVTVVTNKPGSPKIGSVGVTRWRIAWSQDNVAVVWWDEFGPARCWWTSRCSVGGFDWLQVWLGTWRRVADNDFIIFIEQDWVVGG